MEEDITHKISFLFLATRTFPFFFLLQSLRECLRANNVVLINEVAGLFESNVTEPVPSSFKIPH